MQLLSRTPTRHYFLSIFIMASALFFTFSFTIYHYHQESEELNAWVLYNYEVARQSREILVDLVDMETGMRGYLLTGKNQFLSPYQASRSTLNGRITALWNLTKGDTRTHSDIDQWLKKTEQLSAGLDAQVRNRAAGEAISQEALENQRQEMDALRALFQQNTQMRLKNLREQIDTSKKKQENFRYILILGSILVIGGMLLGTLVLMALIRRSEWAEQETRAVEERLLTAMHGIDDGLYDYNPKDDSIYYSPSYKAMLGYSDAELPNRVDSFRDLLHPDDKEEVLSHFRRCRTEEAKSYSSIFRLRHKDGNWVWVLARGVGLHDSQGRVTRLIGTHTDITEQKNREEELQQLNNEMETFTYITSHDLRAPLVNLKGFAGEMERSVQEARPILDKVTSGLPESDRARLAQIFDEDIPESVRFIKQAVVKMDALTTALLNLSSIGKRVFRFVPVNTQEVVLRCLDTFGYEIAQKGIEVTCGQLPTIVCDAVALEQIFNNILDNAVKYTDAGREGRIEVSAEVTGNQVVFAIRDTGRGILEADKEKIFQIFRRARNTDEIRGLGMGMTFVQATLRRLGGTIWFDSTPGAGTVFYFRLPTRMAVSRGEAA